MQNNGATTPSFRVRFFENIIFITRMRTELSESQLMYGKTTIFKYFIDYNKMICNYHLINTRNFRKILKIHFFNVGRGEWKFSQKKIKEEAPNRIFITTYKS